MPHAEDRANHVLAGRYRLAARTPIGAAPEAWRARADDGAEVVAFYFADAAAQSGGASRFLADAPYLRGVEHPRLVALLDAGVDEHGAAWGVCSDVGGETLAMRIDREGALAFDDALRVVCDALTALGALHERGLVHRGITSADVLIVREADGRLHGRLLLGGALGALTRAAHRSAQARVDAFGSPHHLAPEQCRGQEATIESDVWAMGVVLYEALSGGVPFDGDTAIDVVAAVLRNDPPALDPSLPAPVTNVLREALSKRAAERPPDAEAFCLQLSAARASIVPAGPKPSAKPTPTRLKNSGITRGQPTEIAADDLDALIATVKAEASPPTEFDVSSADARAPSAPAPLDEFSFDAPASAPSPLATRSGASLPPPPASASASTPAPAPVIPDFSALDHTAVSDRHVVEREAVQNIDRESLKPMARRPERPRPTAKRFAVNPYVAVVGVLAATAGLGYAGWHLSGAANPRPPAYAAPVEEPADAAAAVAIADASTEAAVPVSHDEPAPEVQSSVEFGEQVRIALPTMARDAQAQFVRHLVTAALPDAENARGFASCADGSVYLHPGGLVTTINAASVEVRCDALDLALVPDIDGDHVADAVAVGSDNGSLVVVGSRGLRVARRIPLQGAVSVVAGLSRTERRRSEPVVVAYVAPQGAPAALVAVGARSGRVYWRTNPATVAPAFARDYGLTVGPDATGDDAPDVAVGTLQNGTRCVTILSGEDGVPAWRAPQCFDGSSGQSLSLGPDVNRDGLGDLAVGNHVERRVRIVSGRDGRAVRMIEAVEASDEVTFGPGAVLMPDVAHDGFADVAVMRTAREGVFAEVYSANDGHRLGRRAVSTRDEPVSAVVRAQYAAGFAFAGSRSVVAATNDGITVLGAAPRPEIADPASAP